MCRVKSLIRCAATGTVHAAALDCNRVYHVDQYMYLSGEIAGLFDVLRQHSCQLQPYQRVASLHRTSAAANALQPWMRRISTHNGTFPLLSISKKIIPASQEHLSAGNHLAEQHVRSHETSVEHGHMEEIPSSHAAERSRLVPHRRQIPACAPNKIPQRGFPVSCQHARLCRTNLWNYPIDFQTISRKCTACAAEHASRAAHVQNIQAAHSMFFDCRKCSRAGMTRTVNPAGNLRTELPRRT